VFADVTLFLLTPLTPPPMKKILSTIVLFSLLSFQNAKNNNEIVSDYLTSLFKRGDFAALEKIIAKDAKYTQAAGLPYGGVYTGLNEWMGMFTKVQIYFDLQLEGEPVLLSDSNNKVVASFTVKLISKKKRKELRMPVAEFFELKDEKIISVTPYYFDTETVVNFIKEDAQ
jgi:ketosteroid isomerase-like protein